MAASDGLSALEGKRAEAVGRRRRQAPPPRHPRAATDEPEAVVDLREDASGDDQLPVPEAAGNPETGPAPAATVGRPRARPTPKGGGTAETEGALRPAQFYVGAQVDDYLRQVRSQAVVRRLDVTASAVVRLAMERLMAELTPEQVTERLAQPVATRPGSGRKRR